jgi:hypothetical protein
MLNRVKRAKNIAPKRIAARVEIRKVKYMIIKDICLHKRIKL